MQRMRDALGWHRADRGHQSLAQGLAAEHALPSLLRAAAAKQVIVELLQVQDGQEAFDGSGGFRVLLRHGATLHGTAVCQAAAGQRQQRMSPNSQVTNARFGSPEAAWSAWRSAVRS